MPFMAAALPYLAVAGAAVSAVGAVQQGQNAQAADNYNAQMQTIKANQSVQAGDAQAQIVAQQDNQKMGEAASAYGAAGVNMTGSPLDVMSGLATNSELNRRLTLYQGQVGAATATNQAGLDSASGSMAAQAGMISAGSTLLTGAGNFLGPNGINVGAAGTSPGANYTAPSYMVGPSGLHVGGT